MPRFISSSPQVPDVLWQKGVPVRRRISTGRRYGMIGLFLLFSTIIGGYWYITDSNRVRAKAEEYLSRITGARVKVGAANLSIFEGLRLDNVQMLVGPPGPDRGDARLFTAQSFRVRVDLTKLVRGRLEAASILAIGPHVRLVEDVDTGRWNYHLLERRSPTTGRNNTKNDLPRLPEITLRNARVDYGRLEGGQFSPTGSMAIEAQLVPDEMGKGYQFRVQSRGESELMGPRIVGAYDLATRRVEARLHNFEFDRDMRTMLPEEVQQWWQRHQLAGRIDVPQLTYTLGGGAGGEFAARVELDGVTMVMRPEESQSADEIWRRAQLGPMFSLLAATGANSTGWVERSRWLIEPQPIALNDAQGEFTFTNAGIEMSNVVGRVEGNSVRIDGRIGGYSPDAQVDLRITSLDSEKLVLPTELRWINSLPPAVRESYDHLRPRGAAALSIHLVRSTRGGRIDVAGQITILDGGFTFDRFPYPIDRATGRIVFGPNAELGVDALELIDLKGYGVAGGPNEKSAVRLDGRIAPLTGDAGVDIRISGNNISTEPTLMRSFPAMTRKALSYLDAPGKGEFPKFTGDFVCSVNRPPGPRQPWSTDVDIEVRNGEGAMLAFPYHLTGIHGQVRVRKDHVDIINATMDRDGAKLVIDGRVDWDDDGRTRRDGEPAVRPKLHITATNALIDDNLLGALPETHRAWMLRLGLTGRFDLEGTVEQRPTHGTGQSEIGFGFLATLKDATLWPKDGTFVVNKINGQIDLAPDSMHIRELRGRRNEGDVALRGTVAWPQNKPSIDLSGEATNLPLDAALYQILPTAGRGGWDVAGPDGTVDATMSFTGDLSGGAGPAYRIELQPRKLAVKPSIFPVRFTDVTGNIIITPEKVELDDLIARRGESRVSFGGSGDLKAGAWDMKLSADRVLADAELIAAMPRAMGELVKSSNLGGTYDVVFKKLKYTSRNEPSSIAAEPQAATRLADEPPGDVEFEVRLETQNGSLVAGMPMTNLVGWVDLAGGSRDEKIGALSGTLNADSFELGGRKLERFTANLSKQADSPVVRLSDLRCGIAGGEIAGRVDWAWPDDGPSRYGMSLVLRDADVRQLVADAGPQLQGSLTASLEIEGAWDDPNSRRGRGDVVVEGRDMYRIPMLLGLFQITNLSLPITRPFERGTISYSMEGNRISLETIELSAEQMTMSGSGHLDFAQKQVEMTFVTDSTAWPTLPIVGELLRGARHELLQIHVRGSLEEPKVSAGSMNTITTTIEEVFRDDDRADQKGKKKK